MPKCPLLAESSRSASSYTDLISIASDGLLSTRSSPLAIANRKRRWIATSLSPARGRLRLRHYGKVPMAGFNLSV
jgi:hypothetical protein